jgi:N-acyl-D-amino-acid deacylase
MCWAIANNRGADRNRYRPQMSQIVEEGVRAGALGFSTSRTILHKSVDGELVPGTTATAEELIGIGRGMGRVGYGVFEMASDLKREWNEFEWMGELSRETACPSPLRCCSRSPRNCRWTNRSAKCARENDNGANIVAQIALRGNGIIMAWQGTVHPFRLRPSWARSTACRGTCSSRRCKRPGVPRSLIRGAESSQAPEERCAW